MNQVQPRKGLAITTLILGLASTVFWLLAAVPGIIIGHIARSRIRKFPQQYTGDGMALAGLVLSYVFLALSLFYSYMLFKNPEFREMVMQQLEMMLPEQGAAPQPSVN